LQGTRFYSDGEYAGTLKKAVYNRQLVHGERALLLNRELATQITRRQACCRWLGVLDDRATTPLEKR
jgi:hypothetical protein